MYHILIVEDEVKIAETVMEYLKRDGYTVTHVTTVTEAMESVSDRVDLIILDLMLPDGNGEDFCEYVVANFSAPVIMLTSKKTEQSRINGFSCGADDYLTKPFSPRELAARVKAVLRRSKPAENTIRLGSHIIMNTDSRTVQKNSEDIKLTPNEYSILLCLASNPKIIVSRDKLIENIKSVESSDRTIDVHIRHLRQKIEEDPKNPEIVKTVHGSGYILGVERE
ncbi:response regulator transcription factor [Geovibrio sp. ADMFC3]